MEPQCGNLTNLLSPAKISVKMSFKIFQNLACLKCHLHMISIGIQKSTKSIKWSLDLKIQQFFEFFQIDAVITK